MLTKEQADAIEDEYFADLCDEAWRRGRNPDAVSRDRFDDRLAAGFWPDEISLDMVLPPKRKRESAAPEGGEDET